MIIRRCADTERQALETRDRSGLNDLIDVTGDALGHGARRRRARVDLQLLLTERRCRARRVIVECAIDGDTVDLVADLIIIATANRERCGGADVAALTGLNSNARNRCERGEGAIEIAAAARSCDLRLRLGIDRVHVGGRTGTHEAAGVCARDRTTDRLERLAECDRQDARVISDDGDARLAIRLEALAFGGDGVRIRREAQKRVMAFAIRGLRRDLRRACCRHFHAGDRKFGRRIDDRPG